MGIKVNQDTISQETLEAKIKQAEKLLSPDSNDVDVIQFFNMNFGPGSRTKGWVALFRQINAQGAQALNDSMYERKKIAKMSLEIQYAEENMGTINRIFDELAKKELELNDLITTTLNSSDLDNDTKLQELYRIKGILHQTGKTYGFNVEKRTGWKIPGSPRNLQLDCPKDQKKLSNGENFLEDYHKPITKNIAAAIQEIQMRKELEEAV